MIVRSDALIINLIIFFALVQIYVVFFNYQNGPLLGAIATFMYLIMVLVSIATLKVKRWNNLIFYILILYTLYLTFLNFNNFYDFFRSIFVTPYLFLAYSFPFIIVFFNGNSLKKIHNSISIMNIIFIIIVFLNFSNLINNRVEFVQKWENLLIFIGMSNFFSLFFIEDLAKRQKILSIIVYFLGILVSLYLARRGSVLTHIVFIPLFLVNLYLYYKKNIKMYVYVFFMTIISLIIYSFFWDRISINFIERLSEDSRSMILDDFFNDMSLSDYIFGKGIGGIYKISSINTFDGSYRNIVEAGYLNILLYGGLNLILLLIFINLFILLKSMGKDKLYPYLFYIIFVDIQSFYAGVYFFSLSFLIFWYCIYVCVRFKEEVK